MKLYIGHPSEGYVGKSSNPDTGPPTDIEYPMSEEDISLGQYIGSEGKLYATRTLGTCRDD